MANAVCNRWCSGAGALVAASLFTMSANAQVHYTYLWHMEQPIYWPDQAPTSGVASGPDRYEVAWQSIQRKDAGAAHPENNLRDIFGLPDRVAGYQYRMIDSLNAWRWTSEGGIQISYSGGLIRNLQSLGAAGQLGYGSNWNSWISNARAWRTNTASPKPRVDVVLFGFHHPLMPLVDPAVVRKDIALYKAVYGDAWGNAASMSRGLFPSEMAFSTRLIEPLRAEGVEWVIVSSEKISRAVLNFPVQLGSGGVNTDPPNRADQVNPAQSNWIRTSISRGCSPADAAPYSLTPRRARYVNPETGQVTTIIVVPAAQALSWQDGYAPIGTGGLAQVGSFGNLAPNRPPLVLLAHDGDNAWGGGFSYYQEATPNLASQASGAGMVATTVEQYLQDHPVPTDDIVHVEDGAWVNADGDFGAPSFLNWNWPLVNAQGQVDIENGWAEDARNWAVITAATNRVVTAEQIATRPGGPQPTGLDMRRMLYPDASTTAAERAWHYLLGSLNSGYMYYGTAVDMEVKPTIACNEAIEHASTVIGSGTLDQTPPTVWTLQRWPWNPGSVNFGPAHGYQQRNHNGDFHIWTFASDVAGIASMTLKYRLDSDGQRTLNSTENETYSGGPGVGAWQSVAMTRRVFPAGNVYNDPTINFFEMPTAIADQYSAFLTGIRSALVDYYVEAVDTRGNITKTPIHHVYVGDGSGGTGGGSVVTTTPTQPTAGQQVTIRYNPAGRPLASATSVCLHWGVNGWTSVQTNVPMSLVNAQWQTTITLPTGATVLDMAFNNCASTWDNNNGQDWHVAVQGGVTPPSFVMDGVRDARAVQVATNNGMNLFAGLIDGTLYVATNDAGEGNDHFIFVAGVPGALRAAPWAKAGQVAGWGAFLADENTNDYEGWFDAPAGSLAMTAANGGVLEGTIDLRAELGLAPGAPLPATIALAVGPYANPDGGALQSPFQVPPAVLANGTLEANEYVIVPLCALTVPTSCAPTCNDLDFNNDTLVPDSGDLDDFVAVLAGGPSACSTGVCDPLDFNNDGLFPDSEDLDAFVRVLSGGRCTP